MNVAAEFTTLLNGLDGLWLPAIDALIKVSLVLGLAGLATLVLGRASAAVRHLVLGPGADERARAPGPLGRAAAMAVADCHPDEQRRAACTGRHRRCGTASRPPRASTRGRFRLNPVGDDPAAGARRAAT